MTEDLGERGSGGEALRGLSLSGLVMVSLIPPTLPRVVREFFGLAGKKILPGCALEGTEGKKEEEEEEEEEEENYLRGREEKWTGR
jgi:hypothetical protein